MSTPAMPVPTTAARREKRTLLASALVNGPAELVDFLLPLWAGIALGVSATEVGVLVALEMAVSVVVRPLAGVLADSRERRGVAASGAALYGLACAGYAFADSIAVAYGAAVVSGVGGALLWVSVRAIVGERLAEDSGVYPRLMAARENGAWVAFVAGLTLLGALDFRGLFLGCAAACFAAAVLLLRSPRRAPAPGADGTPGAHGGADAGAVGLGGVGRTLRPMLFAVAFTMTAEAAVAMLLLLHLQREFHLEVVEAAYVFLPGAIVMGLLPAYLHGLVVRFGRTAILVLASVASAGFALGLAWAPNPFVIAGLWVLSGVSWAAVMPVQEAVVAEASGERIGRGMGLYEAAALVGGMIGTLAAGVLYDTSSWTTACVACAAVILAGAAVVPMSVRALGVPNHPPPAPRRRTPAKSQHENENGENGNEDRDRDGDGVGTGDGGLGGERDGDGGASGVVPAAAGVSAPAVSAGRTISAGRAISAGPVASAVAGTDPGAGAEAGTEAGERPGGLRHAVVEIGKHAAVFVPAQLVLVLVGASWLADLGTGATAEAVLSGKVPDDLGDVAGFCYGAGRIWVFVFVIDAVWRLVAAVGAERRARSGRSAR